MKLIKASLKASTLKDGFRSMVAQTLVTKLFVYIIWRRHIDLNPDPAFKSALGRAVEFLSWFVHPDGSFGGEYGSRRTAVYYPGGIALLADEFPLAAAMTSRMMASISQGHTVTLHDIDIGNLAPLLQSSLLALDALIKFPGLEQNTLPCDQHEVSIDFQKCWTFHYEAPTNIMPLWGLRMEVF